MLFHWFTGPAALPIVVQSNAQPYPILFRVSFSPLPVPIVDMKPAFRTFAKTVPLLAQNVQGCIPRGSTL